MLPLAHALRESGHQVHWAAAEPVCARLKDAGFGATPAGPADVPMPPPPPEIVALPPRERPNFMFSKIFGPRVESMLSDLIPLIEDWQPTMLVCEQAELAGPIAAARAGLPNVTHAFGRLLPPERLVRAAAEVADAWRANGLDPRPFAGTYDHLYLDIYPPSLQAAEIDVMVARRVLPELFGGDLAAGRLFAAMLAEIGVREIVLEGRVATVNAVNALRCLDDEVALLSGYFAERSRAGAVSYLMAR